MDLHFFAAVCVDLDLFVFTQLSLKVEPSESENGGRKTRFHTRVTEGHSRSFHFAVNYRPTRGSISP